MPVPSEMRGGRFVALTARRTVAPLWLKNHLCVVDAGVLIAQHRPGPGLRRAEVLIEGDVIGEGVFGGTAPSTMRAVTPACLRVFDGPEAENLLASDSTARLLLHAMAVRVRRAENYSYNRRTASVRARVARILVDWCVSSGTRHLPSPCDGGFSVSQLADIVSSTPRTVHQTLLTFERAGFVVVRHGGITVQDLQAVSRRARGTDGYMWDRTTRSRWGAVERDSA